MLDSRLLTESRGSGIYFSDTQIYSNENDPSLPSLEYQFSQSYWSQIDQALMTSKELRDNNVLPRAPWEKDPKDCPDPENAPYNVRKRHAFSTALYERLTNGISTHATRKAPDSRQLNENLAYLIPNCDGEGTPLSKLLTQTTLELIRYGVCAILTDYPAMPEGLTVASKKLLAPRATFHLYQHNQVLDHIYTIRDNRKVLKQVRLIEHQVQQVGRFGKQIVPRVRVYEDDLEGNISVTFYERRKLETKAEDEAKYAWSVSEPVYFRNLSEVPVKVIGCLANKPITLSMAECQEELYKFQSYLNQNLFVTSQRKILYFAGISEDERKDGLVPGSNDAYAFRNPSAKAEWISPQDNYEALSARVKAIRNEMSIQSIVSLTEPMYGESGEAKRIDQTSNSSQVKAIIDDLQTALNDSTIYAAQFEGIPEQEIGSIQLSTDFDLTPLDSATIEAFSRLVDKNQLSVETLLAMLIKGEHLPDLTDLQEEVDRINERASASSREQILNFYIQGAISLKEVRKLAKSSGWDLDENVIPENAPSSEVLAA